jgi:hypothetical protein
MREQKIAARLFTYIVFSIVILITFFSIVGFVSSYNYEFVNVTSRVNITNSFPEIMVVRVGAPIPTNVTLNAGSTAAVICNATVRDWNGHNDVVGLNATFYYYLNQSTQPDDKNEHYTNSSCVETANDGNFTVNYTCRFDTYYFAFNGTWYCNVTAIDQHNFTGSGNNSTKINPLYALNVTDIIDYGNLSVLDTSDNITATVTNFGNMNINVSVLGYGLTQGDGIGLICQYGNNISVQFEKFSSTPQNYSAKTALGVANKDMGSTILRQTNDAVPVTLDTYWQLYVPPNPFGLCTGTVRFTATTP